MTHLEIQTTAMALFGHPYATLLMLLAALPSGAEIGGAP